MSTSALEVAWKRSARWCVDGKFYTSSGVAAGIDVTHFFLKELFGEKVRDLQNRVKGWGFGFYDSASMGPHIWIFTLHVGSLSLLHTWKRIT